MRICFLGDSFVNGTGDPAFLGWVGRVCAQANRRDLTAYNLGIRRDTSRDLAARWQSEARLRLPDAEDGRLVFSFGVNDCCDEADCRRVAPADTLAIAGDMLAQAARWKPVLMIGPPPIAAPEINVRTAALSPELAGLCAALGVPYLEIFRPLAADPIWMHEVAAGDGAHPGARGYDILAELVAAWSAWRAWMAELI